MSKVGPEGRSYAEIALDDLRKLQRIAQADRQGFFAKYPDWAALYENRVLCAAQCQGAALHYLRREVGINDFDVYTFYAVHPAKAWYAKRLKSYDFGSPKFGQSSDKPRYIGRRVDILGRSVPAMPRANPIQTLRDYLHGGSTMTARLLAEKAVVILEPLESLGYIVWPIV